MFVIQVIWPRSVDVEPTSNALIVIRSVVHSVTVVIQAALSEHVCGSSQLFMCSDVVKVYFVTCNDSYM